MDLSKVGLFCVLIALVVGLAGCSDSGGNPSNVPAPIEVSGQVQKGPFIIGTEITVQELNDDLTSTGISFQAETTNNLGEYSLPVTLTESLVEVNANGYYFNEVTDSISGSTLRLSALADTAESTSINVNILTHLAKKRIRILVAAGNSFSEAKQQAEMEVRHVFSFDDSGASLPNFDRLDISQSGSPNAFLLLTSSLLQKAFDSTAELSEYLSKLSQDLSDNGEVEDSALTDLISRAEDVIDLEAIRRNLYQRYTNLGMTVAIPDFEGLINRKPVAVITGEITVETGSLVSLSGEQSIDLDHDNLIYNWGVESAPEDHSFEEEMMSNTDNFTLTTGSPGEYVIRLMVSDGILDSEVVTHTVQVLEPSYRELMVDESLIETVVGEARLKLHQPVRMEVALTYDMPWEGNASGYPTILKDGGIYRMYYRGSSYLLDGPSLHLATSEVVCYAESTDGINWVKPNLQLYKSVTGTKDNNIIWPGSSESHNFSPFKDSNPDTPADERYKAVAGTNVNNGLLIFKSADGIHWSKIVDYPVITKGAFDSLNTVFWDRDKQRYSVYLRDVKDGVRHISVSHSIDFRNWSDPVPINFLDSPPQHMYTNNIGSYYRAPHILLGFPARYVYRSLNDHVIDLGSVELRDTLFDLDERLANDLTDGAFISSRDGVNFKRWNEAFLRPGYEAEGGWFYGDNFQSNGLWETKSEQPGSPNELSMHFSENTWTGEHRVRRYTIRLDGFVSMNAPYEGGEVITKPINLIWKTLSVNYSTSSAGSLRIELQDDDGNPIPGYALADAIEYFGDSTDQQISWANGPDLSSLIGKSVRIRFVLKDGDLFSYQFK